jgi:hypothetical protein
VRPPERPGPAPAPRAESGTDAAQRLADAEARRVEWEARIRSDPARLAAGWERRFLADPARTREAAEIYERMGFEVALDPVRPADLEDGCADCVLISAAGFRMIYTRRRSR